MALTSFFGHRTALKGVSLLAMIGLGACDLAPAYKPPHFVVPDSWHGQAPFAPAAPADATLPTNWWTLFHDPLLDKLEDRAIAENGDLQAAGERFLQARSLVARARADLLPHLSLEAGGSDNKQSEDRLFRNGATLVQTQEEYGGLATWEPDLWSSIRNRVRINRQAAQDSAAQFAMARLSLQAELAYDYIQLRGYDAQIAIYQQSIAYYQRALRITQNQLQNKAAPRLDLARAQAQLYSTQAALYDIQAARQVTEHALAVLTNSAPSSFQIDPVQALDFKQPSIPTGIPSGLLQRRPDIASSERRMAEANRAIGIARAAFYPHFSLNADGGFEANGFKLAKLANSLWTYGARMNLPLFDGGIRRAELQRTWSSYREMRDSYRATVLSAFREVEDGLSRTNRLNVENQALEKAVEANLASQNMTMTLYQGGVGTYLDAIFSQENTLRSRITQVEVATRLYQADIGLVRSLGGGWNVTALPTMGETNSVGPFQYGGLHHARSVGDIHSSEHPENSENLTTPAPDIDGRGTNAALRPLPTGAFH
ncbi:efflux transporter outer membrane subunit [Saccharibacter floricola]|uniref:Secretion system type I outer membrane efflux pump lipoprotein NodT n=1 Tax=Saccharibacter floricola DSM 15669 TaxID=1123227 RepID=A0ABQ0NZJ1_9PROT|nr:efflux transporter outer membrane subunit [Saccharibacter floricola]GBQ07427.1 secretion system type I outer membrane efflux pump lipoprotein NodT [Saccharibacter floricola DSM 15669]